MNTFLTSNETPYRLARTIFQGLIGAVIAYLDVLIGMFAIPDELRPFIVLVVMAVLSPVMSCIKSGGKEIVLYGGENDAVTEIEHELNDPDDVDEDEEDGDE